MTTSKDMFMEEREQSLLHESSRHEREQFAHHVIRQIENGLVDPLKIHLQLKSTEDIIDRFTNKKDHPETATRYNELLLDEAGKYGKKFDLHNATFQISEAGTKYDYTKTNDPVIAELHSKLESLKEEIKTRETFLKTVPAAGLPVLSDGGEIVTVFPPSKTSTTILKTTLK